MPKITDISLQKRRNDRFSIFIDGKFRLSLSQNQLVDSGLRIGDELDDDQVTRLQESSEFGKTLDKAYNFLSYRTRSSKEVRDHLWKKRIDSSLIDQVVETLEENGLLNDEAFAREWVENRQLLSPRSRRQLQAELRQKGIASSEIENVLADIEPDDEVKTLTNLIEQKKLRFRYDDERKLIQYLSGKGFRYDTIKAALENLSE